MVLKCGKKASFHGDFWQMTVFHSSLFTKWVKEKYDFDLVYRSLRNCVLRARELRNKRIKHIVYLCKTTLSEPLFYLSNTPEHNLK